MAPLRSLSQSRVAGFTPTNIVAVLGLLSVMDFGAVDYGTLVPVSSRYQHSRVYDLACLLPGHVAAQSCFDFMLRRPLDGPGDGCLMFTVDALVSRTFYIVIDCLCLYLHVLYYDPSTRVYFAAHFIPTSLLSLPLPKMSRM